MAKCLGLKRNQQMMTQELQRSKHWSKKKKKVCSNRQDLLWNERRKGSWLACIREMKGRTSQQRSAESCYFCDLKVVHVALTFAHFQRYTTCLSPLEASKKPRKVHTIKKASGYQNIDFEFSMNFLRCAHIWCSVTFCFHCKLRIDGTFCNRRCLRTHHLIFKY